MTDRDQELRDFLARATEEPPDQLIDRVAARVSADTTADTTVSAVSSGSQEPEPATSPIVAAGRTRSRLSRRMVLATVSSAAAALVVFVVLTSRQRPRSPVPSKPGSAVQAKTKTKTGEHRTTETVLDVDLTSWPTVRPTKGPSLKLETRGGGRAETPKGPSRGVRFVPGGQQSTDTEFLTNTGLGLDGLFSAADGSLSITLQPTVDLVDRTTPTGRNISTYFQLVNDQVEQPELITQSTLLGISLHLDPEIGPYLAVSLNGKTESIPIPQDRRPEFTAGSNVDVRVDWAGGDATLSLNDQALHQFVYPLTVRPITNSARLSIGASADYGAGYFAAHEDLLMRITLSARKTSS